MFLLIHALNCERSLNRLSGGLVGVQTKLEENIQALPSIKKFLQNVEQRTKYPEMILFFLVQIKPVSILNFGSSYSKKNSEASENFANSFFFF